MALRLRSSDPDPIAQIKPITDDPHLARLTAQLNVLRRALEARTDEQEIMALQHEIDRGMTSTRGQIKTRARERITKLQAKIPAPEPEPQPTDGLDPVVVIGLKLAAGETLPPPIDRQARLAKLRDEVSQLNAALRVVHGQLDVLREDLSEAICKSLVPQHQAILNSKLMAALALAAADRAERELRRQIVLGGYHHYAGILISPPLPQAGDLGDIADMGSVIWHYRNAIEGGPVFSDAPITTNQHSLDKLKK